MTLDGEATPGRCVRETSSGEAGGLLFDRAVRR